MTLNRHFEELVSSAMASSDRTAFVESVAQQDADLGNELKERLTAIEPDSAWLSGSGAGGADSSSERNNDPLLGTTISGCSITEKLGGGCMGVV